MSLDWMPLLVLAVWLVSRWVRIVREDQRLVLLRLGKVGGLKGPGVVFVFTPIDRALILSVGDEGERTSADSGEFHGVPVRIWPEDPIPLGGKVRIVGFEGSYAVRVAGAKPEGEPRQPE